MSSYTPIYRFMDATSAVKSILNKNLRISDISKLNDPYDILPGITNFPDNYHKEVNVWDAAERLRKKLSKEFGVLCFSGCCNEPVIWEHYAANHTGISALNLTRMPSKTAPFSR